MINSMNTFLHIKLDAAKMKDLLHIINKCVFTHEIQGSTMHKNEERKANIYSGTSISLADTLLGLTTTT